MIVDLYIDRYKWLPGMSVTSLEIMTGAYWDRNPNVSQSHVKASPLSTDQHVEFIHQSYSMITYRNQQNVTKAIKI